MPSIQFTLASLLAIGAAVANPLDTRATLVHCNSQQQAMMESALSQASRLASAGAETIRSGSSYSDHLFQTFFKTSDESTKSHVADVLDQIAEEASNQGGGLVTYSCTPDGIQCSESEAFTITAYGETDGHYGNIRTCPAYFNFPDWSENCDTLDQATSSTHELAHTKGIYGTETYGYYAIQRLDTQSALVNAESYAFFSKAAFLNCQV